MGLHREFEGRSVEKALNKASDDLEIATHDLEYEIIDQGASGIFGLVGVRKAKISVSIPSAAAPKETTQDDVIAKNQPSAETDQTLTEDVDSDKADTALERGSAFLSVLAENITPEISIESTVTRQKLKINLCGKNPALLIGRRGETLEALQYLTEKVANRGQPGRVRVQLDVEGYMQNRRNNIRNLSFRLAEKAKRRGRPVTVGQMPPHERRLVHVTLRDEPGVRTQSVGAGFIRKIMVFPENGQQHHRRKSRSRRSE